MLRYSLLLRGAVCVVSKCNNFLRVRETCYDIQFNQQWLRLSAFIVQSLLVGPVCHSESLSPWSPLLLTRGVSSSQAGWGMGRHSSLAGLGVVLLAGSQDTNKWYNLQNEANCNFRSEKKFQKIPDAQLSRSWRWVRVEESLTVIAS